MWMREFYDTLVNCVGRANTEDKNRCYERPEEPFFSKPEGMFA